MAITQAAAYIRKTKVSIRRYITLLNDSEETQSNLLGREFPDLYRSDVPNSVMRTWTISMQQIGRESQLAQSILNTIAFFDNQGLPFELLAAAAGPEWSEEEVLLAAGRLAEYSFLQIQKQDDEELPIYTQHRLIPLATRKRLDIIETRSIAVSALKLMANLFPEES